MARWASRRQPPARMRRPQPGALWRRRISRMSDSKSRTQSIELRVLRYRPASDQEPVFVSYVVPYSDDMSVLQALQSIKDTQDGSLSYRWSCHMAVCGSCGMMINGEPKLSCHAFLRDYRDGVVRIEPLGHFPIERDLVIVMDSFMEKLSSVKPYVIVAQEKPLSEGEYLQTPLQL